MEKPQFLRFLFQLNIMVNKCVVGYRSNYHEEIIFPAFSFTTKHENRKSKRIRFAKDRKPSLTVCVVYISHFEGKFF